MSQRQPPSLRRTLWRNLHRWLGLFIGAWFALVGLSGSILVFDDEVDAFLNPQLLKDPRHGTHLPPEAILARVAEAFPLAKTERLRPPQAAGEVYRVTLRVAPHLRTGSPRAEAMFSAVNGELLGTREAGVAGITRPYWMRTLYEFHRNVLLGNFGSNIVGIAGLLLMSAALSGFIVAWPRNRSGWRRLVGVKFRSGLTRILFDVHRSSGVILFVLLMLATVTGSTLVYVNYARDIVSVFSPVAPFPVIPWRETSVDNTAGFDEIAARVRNEFPQRAMMEIHVPSKPTAGYLFYLKHAGDVHRLGDTIIWVHPGSGEILFECSARNRTKGETVMHWLFPLHSGTAFGAVGKVAMCVTGLAMLLMFPTGLWVWLRKRRAEQFEQARRERAHAERVPAPPSPSREALE
ncbi:MAG: PepSY domain-containing protein [Betaproteobacteria bacterium]|nr:PepSY domain-containing protein [Betaproteobacteria bacterium]